jgi:DNA-binding NarL/FixJ family response regulator
VATEPAKPRSIVALVPDLVMQSQLAAAARGTACELATAHTAEELLARAAERAPRLAIVDLSTAALDLAALDLAALVERLRPHVAPGATLLAFGPHVHKSRLEAAAAAGFDVVLSRGQFHAQLDELIRLYA